MANKNFRVKNGLEVAGSATIDNDLVVTGNLTVNGDTTTLNTQTLNVEDNTVMLNSNVTGTPTLDAGIAVKRGTDANSALIWVEAIDKWVQNRAGTSTVIPINTGELAEGSNLYFTDARARAAVAGGTGITVNSDTGVIATTVTQYTDGSARSAISAGIGISYNSTTGVIDSTITQYTDAMARSALSAGTGISYNSTTGAISTTITQYTDASARSALSGGTGISYNSTTGAIAVDTSTIATKTYADSAASSAVAAIIDTAPTTLDTLNELAAALGDDPNFATTVTTALGTKLASADFNSTFDTRLATKSTSNLAEGSNLYYTDARVLTKINATGIDALSDVVITSAAAGQMMYYNGTNWVNSVTVDSPNLNRFSRTADGTLSNTIVAISRNRADAARATDGGPWLGFEYVGTDNTQTTAPQSAIRSMYDSGGNHKMQVLQFAGNYASPVVVGQIQRGNVFFNNTSGTNMAAITGSGTTLTSSGFASIIRTASTASTVSGLQMRLSRTDVSGQTDGDGIDFRFGVGGTSTSTNFARFDGVYKSSGLNEIGMSVSTDNFAADTDRIYIGTRESTKILATPSGGGTVTAIGTFTDTSVALARPVAYPSYTTTQRDALTPSAGWVLWNSTATKLQVYTGSAWADLH